MFDSWMKTMKDSDDILAQVLARRNSESQGGMMDRRAGSLRHAQTSLSALLNDGAIQEQDVEGANEVEDCGPSTGSHRRGQLQKRATSLL
mmetsp:Transcript_89070/g.240739  ORF Transcript_89070/g.240739 Transcript_89070/m.240739 type:complete len:90 (+) Transcript_89070:675-944(+)